MKGFIVVIEGTDGCGKETQSKLLAQKLNGMDLSIATKAFRQSFPNYGSVGAKPVEALLSGELGEGVDALDVYQSSVLFAVDRLLTYKTILNRHIKNNEIIIFDRYVESNLLYQATRIEDKNEYENYVDWLLDFEYKKLSLPKPNVIIFLDMPPYISQKLIEGREIKNGSSQDIYEKNKEYMDNVYNKGVAIAKHRNFNIIHCVDDSGNLKTIEKINDEISSIVLSELEKVQNHNKNSNILSQSKEK